MQRNDLITELSQHENGPVAVNINGRICDVLGVAPGGDSTAAPASAPSTV
jgi:hypothetical protein